MFNQQAVAILAGSLAFSCFAAEASDLKCTDPDDPNHTFSVEGERGIYTWDDHGVRRSRELKCFTQSDGSTACHQWGQDSEDGSSAMIYRMLPDGTLVEAGAWALLDVSRVVAMPGFLCTS